MAGNDWLGDRRTEVAADRILDAADALFAQQDAATVGMHEIAKAAGCSRATLYRYFENREALYTAYVHRESYRLFHQMSEQLTGVDDPRERLHRGHGLVAAQRPRKSRAVIVVRHRTATDRRRRWPSSREVIKALTEAFLISMAPAEPEVVERKRPLAGAGDDVAAGVPRPRRGRRTRDDRAVRRPDGGADDAGSGGLRSGPQPTRETTFGSESASADLPERRFADVTARLIGQL